MIKAGAGSRTGSCYLCVTKRTKNNKKISKKVLSFEKTARYILQIQQDNYLQRTNEKLNKAVKQKNKKSFKKV